MSLTKIVRLTSAQERALIAYRDEWLAIGRGTTPADRTECEAVFARMYAALGEAPPAVLWWDGPATGAIARTLLGANLGANLWANLWDNLWANLWANLGDNLRANLRANLRDNLWANLWANLRDNLWANLWANLRANLGDNLGDNLRANLRANLGDNLGDNLWANLGDNLRANLGTNLGANLRANLWANLGANLGANLSWAFWGRHAAAWPTFYAWPDAALRSMHTDEQRVRLNWWLTLARHCGWWHPFREVVFACEPPERQDVDDGGRLHRIDGPALLCRDGFPVYAWHGVRVPAWVIEQPDRLTVADIGNERNAEVRRVMLERFGTGRYLRETRATKLDASDYGTLWRANLPDDEPLVMVEVTNRTAEPDGSYKQYLLRVPPSITRAREAVAWTFDLNGQQYVPAAES